MKSSFPNHMDGKNSVMKQRIVGLCVSKGDYSLADLSKELNSSIPTITKLVGELIDEGFLVDMGKLDTSGGRRPSIYGLNPEAGYFVGINAGKDGLSIAVTDFKGKLMTSIDSLRFFLESSEESFRQMCGIVKEYLSENEIEMPSVLAYGLNVTGRVNHQTGYSFIYDLGKDISITSLMETELKAPVYLENDSRAMTYGEYISGAYGKTKDMLFLNVSWGLGMGIIMDGNLVYGKSGFSGEIGHLPLLNNNQICQCGKTGCLETGASGRALHRMVMEKLGSGRSSVLSEKFEKNEKISLCDIMDAIQQEDMLAIETLEEIGTTLGRAIAGMVNLFNPEVVVVGGFLANAQEYLLLPIRSALQKFSLSIINRDTEIRFSKLGKKAGPLGACILSRTKLLGLI